MPNSAFQRGAFVVVAVLAVAWLSGCGFINGGLGAPSVPELVFGEEIIDEEPVCFAAEVEDGCICEGEDCVCDAFDCGCDFSEEDADCTCYENFDEFDRGNTFDCFDASAGD